jgi:hypothetical protein
MESPQGDLAGIKRPYVLINYVIGLCCLVALFNPASGHFLFLHLTSHSHHATPITNTNTTMSPLPDFLLDVARNPVLAGTLSFSRPI